MTVHELIAWGTETLSKHHIDFPKKLSEDVLSDTLSIRYEKLILEKAYSVSSTAIETFKEKINRLTKNEPLAYVLGYTTFFKHKFFVNEQTLIPRPETELLVERIVNDLKNKTSLNVIDIGTGSGCIIASISLALKNSHQYFASDISKEALKIAEKNFDNLNTPKIHLKESNLLSSFNDQKFDVIIANLPYVPKADFENSPDKNKLSYEPFNAIVAEDQGLFLIKKLLKESTACLAPKGVLYLEINYDQTSLLKEVIKNFYPLSKVEVLKDYNGFDRFIKISLE